MRAKIWINVILVLAVSGLTAFNFALQHRVRELSARNSELQSNQAPLPGTFVPYLVGYDLAHRPIKFNYAQQSDKTLLLLLSPQCRYCEKNWVFWRRLLTEAHGAKVVIVDVSGDVTSAYFDNLGIPAPDAVIKIDPVMRLAYNFNAVPETIVLGPKGQVLDVWIGILTDDSLTTMIQELIKSH